MATPGLLLVDKPAGYTSHDVVAKLRKILGTRKIGHAGTLDPMATGLLVIGVEAGTKLLTFIVGNDKTYEATIRLGSSTVTNDAQGELVTQASPETLEAVSEEDIRTGIAKLTGTISQVPSAVSAIKVAGVRSYDRVRAGEEVTLKPREVVISRFDLTSEIRFTDDYIDLDVVVDCSSGTYIRALARDLGADLGVGGHLTALRRTRVGKFSIEDALTLDELASGQAAVLSLIDSVRQVMPVVEFSFQEAQDIRNGKRVSKAVSSVAAAISGEDLVAIVEPADSGSVKSLVVFSGGN